MTNKTAQATANPSPPTMRHITRLRIENFQSHADTDIHLEPGINLFTGLGDAGKTAVLRALNLVLHNQPRGKDFIRWGETEARVTVWFSDGIVVQRIKGDRNTVLLQKPDGTKKSFDRIGNDLPDEVREALGNPPVNDKQGPLSYAEQLRPMFLITLTPTELPRVLSELTQIDDYQDAADRLGKRSREMEKAVKGAQGRIDLYSNQLEAYDGLDEEDIYLAQCEDQATYIENLESEINLGKNLLTRMREVISQGKIEVAALKVAKRLSSHAEAAAAAMDRMQRASAARELYARSVETSENLVKNERALLQTARLGSGVILDEAMRLRAQIEEVERMQACLAEVRNVFGAAKQQSTELSNWSDTYATLEKERERYIEEMKEAGFWCNHCNRPLMEEDKCHA